MRMVVVMCCQDWSSTSNKHNLQLEYNIGAIYRNRQYLLQQPLKVLLTTRNRSTIYSKSSAIYSSSWRCHQHIEKVMPITGAEPERAEEPHRALGGRDREGLALPPKILEEDDTTHVYILR